MTALRFTVADLLFCTTFVAAGVFVLLAGWKDATVEQIGPPIIAFISFFATPALFGAAIGALYQRKARGAWIAFCWAAVVAVLFMVFTSSIQ